MVFRSPWPEIELPSCSICDVISGVARRYADKQAVVESETERTLTYEQLIERVDRVAAGLLRAGLKPGHPLALALPNCIDFLLGWFGALRAGAWVVPISPLHTPAEMEMQIRDAGARHVLTAPERAADLAAIVQHVFVPGGNWNDIVSCLASPPSLRTSVEELAVMPYSSGTTGKPKGVMLTHFNIVSNLRQFSAVVPLKAEDVMVNIAPLYHATGLAFLIGLLA